MTTTFFAFIGALNIDSSLNVAAYNSLITLLPYIFLDSEFSSLLKNECLAILQEQNNEIIQFTEIFRVTKDPLNKKFFLMNNI